MVNSAPMEPTAGQPTIDDPAHVASPGRRALPRPRPPTAMRRFGETVRNRGNLADTIRTCCQAVWMLFVDEFGAKDEARSPRRFFERVRVRHVWRRGARPGGSPYRSGLAVRTVWRESASPAAKCAPPKDTAQPACTPPLAHERMGLIGLP